MTTHNSKLSGLVAIKKLLTMAATTALQQSQPFELIEWRTEKGEAQQLELFIFPLATGEAFNSVTLDPGIWGTYQFELQVTQGAPSGQGLVWETSAPLAGTSQPRSYLFVPAHGLRTRITCVAARLRLLTGVAGASVGIFASFTPCVGGQVSRPVPDIMQFPNVFSGPVPQPIPKGARECRFVPDDVENVQSNLAWYQFTALNLISSEQCGTYYDWRPIPGNAYYVNLLLGAGFGTGSLYFR